jgi:hypothetical protein
LLGFGAALGLGSATETGGNEGHLSVTFICCTTSNLVECSAHVILKHSRGPIHQGN